MKKDVYKIDNSVEKILQGKQTLFLDQKELLEVKSRLHKQDYNIYYPYKSSDKVILYKNSLPKVSLFQINSYGILRHQDILGAILNLNISSSYLGDIIIDNDKYYFYVLDELSDFIINNLKYIGSNKVSLIKQDVNYLSDYEREYEEIEIIISSNRIDNVLARLINTNRDNVIKIIKNKEVILNYEVLFKNSYTLKDNDIFSIRKYGKYKYLGVINTTKKGKIVVKLLKYK